MQTSTVFQLHTFISHTVSRNTLKKKIRFGVNYITQVQKTMALSQKKKPSEKKDTLKIYQAMEQKKKATNPSDENSFHNA